MSRIEELPDDFDQNIDINRMPAGQSMGDVYADDSRNEFAAKSIQGNKSAEETLQEFGKTPLFMNNLDVIEEGGTSGSDSAQGMSD